MSLFATHLQKNASAIAGLVEDLQSNGILIFLSAWSSSVYLKDGRFRFPMMINDLVAVNLGTH